jgi:hypothetical protein
MYGLVACGVERDCEYKGERFREYVMHMERLFSSRKVLGCRNQEFTREDARYTKNVSAICRYC